MAIIARGGCGYCSPEWALRVCRTSRSALTAERFYSKARARQIGIGVSVGTTVGFEEDSALIGIAWAAGALILGIGLLTFVYRPVLPGLSPATVDGFTAGCVAS